MPLLLALRFWEVTTAAVTAIIAYARRAVISANPVTRVSLITNYVMSTVATGIAVRPLVLQRLTYRVKVLWRTFQGAALVTHANRSAAFGVVIQGATVSGNPAIAIAFRVTQSQPAVIGGTVLKPAVIAI